MDVQRVGIREYRVRSESNENDYHTVMFDKNGYAYCSCMGFAWNMTRKHIVKVLQCFEGVRGQVLSVLDRYEDVYPNLVNNPALIMLLVLRDKDTKLNVNDIVKLVAEGKVDMVEIMNCLNEMKESGFIKTEVV